MAEAGGSPREKLDQGSSPRPSITDDRARLLLGSLPEGVCEVDADGRIAFVNPAATRILGRSAQDAMGAPVQVLLRRGDEDPSRPCPMQGAHPDDLVAHAGDDVVWTPAGRAVPVEFTAGPMREDGRVVGTVVVFREARELQDGEGRRALADHVAYASRHDDLTGLVTRAFFRDRLDHAMAGARRAGHSLALLFVDLDRFKSVNDTLGHDAGDHALQHAARCLLGSVRNADTVARLGGDEFLVLMEDVDEGDAAGVAHRIGVALAKTLRVRDRELTLSSSIGVAMFPRDGGTEAELRQAADAAMYRAKADGGSGFRFFTSDMNDAARERVELVEALRRAVDGKQFELHFQPQVALGSGAAVSVEALLRWRRPRHGLVDAATFIRTAEDSGIIVPLGQWALRAACAQVSSWRAKGATQLRVAVNVCSRQLHPSGFPAQVMQTLSDTGLAPDALVLEITQADLFDDLDDSLAELRGLGVRVALDDFGIGRISVRGLADLPLDAVKLDRAIVGNLPADAGDRAVTRSVIALAHDVGLEVCAEGVETEEQREFLGALGCDAAGGGICSAGRWRRRRSSGGSGARPQRSAATNSEPMRRGEPPRGVKITL